MADHKLQNKLCSSNVQTQQAYFVSGKHVTTQSCYQPQWGVAEIQPASDGLASHSGTPRVRYLSVDWKSLA